MTLTVAGAPTVTTVDGRGFAVRHVRPGSGEGASTVTVLGRAYGFEWLPMSTLPASPDLVEGSYTRRLGDAGEFTLRFPNVASSKGLWREKFSESGALEFVEIYRDDRLEFVGSIERVEVDRGTVTISGGDGWSLLKRAYERDREWWDAPATVIDTYTRVPVPVLREQWADLSAWTETSGTASVADGALVLDTTNVLSADVSAAGTDTWMLEAQIPVQPSTTNGSIALTVTDGSPSTVGTMFINLNKNGVTGEGVSNGGAYYATNQFPPTEPVSAPTSLRIIRNGRTVSGYVGGNLVGVIETDGAAAEGITITSSGGSLLGELVFTDMSPFLHRGTDDGDIVLPGDLPTGGLRGRYHNIGNMQGFAAARRREQTLTFISEPYAERLDEVVNSSTITLPVTPGAATSYYAIRWTGAVYLPLSGGQIEFRVTSLDDGVRVWVGDTAWDAPLVDDWADGASRTTSTGTTALGSEDGWYPIRVEYYNAASTGTIQLQFRRVTPGWTDPGGTSITANTWTTIPATSLSPLGCHEARIQGQSHFAIIQDVAAQAGYQLLLEPMSLESGEFPGRLVPRLRVGRDTDVVLEVEDDPSAEPILTPAVTRDASDQAVRVIGTGSGSADGRGSQTIAEVADLTSDALFELQSWTDAGDATLPQLLEARLNAELALRATPWEEVRGVPRAFERLADTWPLTGTLSAMRWRPGDGLRISVPDIGVRDTDPRQLTQVTRSFAAEGRTSTQVAWRQRPRSATEAIRRLARSQALAVRSNQGQPVTLVSDPIASGIASGSWTDYAFVSLLPQDTVRRAVVKVNQWTGTSDLDMEVNGTDRTSALGGPWATAPLEIDVTAYATQASTTDNRFYVRMQQSGGNAGAINLQLVVEVLR